ncbi:MFS transporter [Actinacidiphila sp. bgisy145]|uniref:MFS transporter n=1 Tax=Actinacidiphila sp. bgisy145 TaxID=3413792 RepID=UPI003EBB4273
MSRNERRPPLERRLILSFGILSLGTGMSTSVLAVYLVRQLHASAGAFGVTMSLAALCGMVSGPLAGRLADSGSARRTYARLVCTMAAATGLLAVVNAWTAFGLICLLFICGRGSGAVMGALVRREISADRRVRYRAMVKTVSNAAMLIGLSLGGVVLSVNSFALFRTSFVVEAVTLCTAAFLVATAPSGSPQTLIADDPADQSTAAETADIAGAPSQTGRRTVYRDGRFLVLAALNAFLLLYSSVFSVALPLWISAQASSLLWLVSVVSALNIGVVLLLQVPVSRNLSGAVAAVRAGRRGGILLGGGLAMFAVAGSVHGTGPKVAAIVLLSLLVAGGEVLYSAASWELVYTLAPPESVGEYQGVYNMGLDVSMLVAPALFGWLASSRHTAAWLVMAGLFAACALLLRSIAGRGMQKGHSGTEASRDVVEATR